MKYSLGSCTIDTEAYEIRRGGEPVAVEPQVFDLLVLLLRNRGRLVTKDEIFQRIWNGRIVSDAALSSRVKSMREAIGDDGASQALIRTIRGRGFRFVGPVTESAAAERSADATVVPRTRSAALRRLSTSVRSAEILDEPDGASRHDAGQRDGARRDQQVATRSRAGPRGDRAGLERMVRAPAPQLAVPDCPCGPRHADRSRDCGPATSTIRPAMRHWASSAMPSPRRSSPS